MKHQHHKPERLNLAIARRCFVACRGCYSYFGKQEPDLLALAKAVAIFARLGVDVVTISGGDPLTIKGLLEFLTTIRSSGVRTIKVDTVGTTLLTIQLTIPTDSAREKTRYLDGIMAAVDYLGIPLDGWSNATVCLFRKGRPRLYDETISLLKAVDDLGISPNIIINTVAHKHNLDGLRLILDEVISHRSVCHWNVFQYTSTDQAARGANEFFAISTEQFAEARSALLPTIERIVQREAPMTVEFRSTESRLGKYLLINSDGNAWLPNEDGQTVSIGAVFGREQFVLERWSELVSKLLDDTNNVDNSSPWEYLVAAHRPH